MRIDRENSKCMARIASKVDSIKYSLQEPMYNKEYQLALKWNTTIKGLPASVFKKHGKIDHRRLRRFYRKLHKQESKR